MFYPTPVSAKVLVNDNTMIMENKQCPRCNASFECKADDILNCQCNGILFIDPQKQRIAKDFNDCLCRKCLLELQQEQVKSLTPLR